MTLFYLFLALLLLLTILAGLWRVARGPGVVDRMIAAQLFGTTGVAMVLLMAKGLQLPVLRDVALVLALLTVVTLVGFIRHYWSGEKR